MSTRTKTPKSTKAKGKNKPGTPIDKNPVQDDKVGIPENGEPVTKQGDTSQSETPKTSTANPGENKIENSPENGEPVTKQGDTSQSETPETSTANPGENKIENSPGGEISKGNESGLPAEIRKRAKEVFSEHKVDVIYCTNDGTMFLHPQFARIHAQGLKDNSFITINRQEV